MGKVLLIVFTLLVLGNPATAQQQYEVITGKNGEQIFKGIISREVLLGETSFKWYEENLKGYTPNSLALEAIKQYGDSVEIIAFMGTWCEDSHIIIPRLYSLLDAAGFPGRNVTLIGTDREKKTIGHLVEALNIRNVPTLLLMKDGKEIGRVVEYGKYGMWDKELGEIINAGFAR